MDAATREFVRQRAGNSCEYCRMPQEATPFISFHIEHIVAKQHVEIAGDDVGGLALACDRCNAFKGPNLSTIDPLTGDKVDLFNPRLDSWGKHFCSMEGEIVGLSAVGRATARLLNMNAARRVELRKIWLDEGPRS